MDYEKLKLRHIKEHLDAEYMRHTKNAEVIRYRNVPVSKLNKKHLVAILSLLTRKTE